MSIKRVLFALFAVIAISIVIAVGVIELKDVIEPSYTLTPLDRFIIDWELGEEIIPYPPYGEWRDCDDATLYSFYYLEGLHRDFEMVFAQEGVDGLEAYTMALTSILAAAQHGMESIVSIVAQTQNNIISLFSAATR